MLGVTLCSISVSFVAESIPNLSLLASKHMKYDAVIFDLLGTLVPSPLTQDYRHMVDRIADALGLPRDEFFDRWMPVNNDRLLGTFGSSEGDIQHVASLFGLNVRDHQMAECVHSRRAAMLEWLTPKTRTMNILTRLTELDIKLALVSDCSFDVPAVWERTPLSGMITTTVFSCVERLRKPDKGMYLRALAMLDVRAASALFVGDGGSDELRGAERLGISAVLLDDHPKDSSKEFRVDVQEWYGLSIADISDVVSLVATVV